VNTQTDEALAEVQEAFALACAYHQAGRHDAAVLAYEAVLELKPDFENALINLGGALQALGRMEEAAATLRRALDLRPDFPEALCNLGMILRYLGQPEEAEARLRRALMLKPDFAEASCHLGNALRDLSRREEAEAAFRRTLEQRPDFLGALAGLGQTLRDLGKLEEAEACWRRALALRPHSPELWFHLGQTLFDQGKADEALAAGLAALETHENTPTKALFLACAKQADPRAIEGAARTYLARALAEPWEAPGGLVFLVASLVKANPGMAEATARAVAAGPRRLSVSELFSPQGVAAIISDPLPRALLTSTPVPDLDMERCLTLARQSLLDAALAGGEAGLTDLHAALAGQCFINEYVFDDRGAEQAATLRDALVAALESGDAIPVAWVLSVACYFPLHALPHATRLLDRTWPEVVESVLTRQIREPEQERRLRSTIPRLTAIEDGVSLAVQQQYEENPYPRWSGIPRVESPLDFDALLARMLPRAQFQPLGNDRTLDVLIAGCGTGQHSIDSAQSYANARILAIDLSLSSLAYAKRKSLALGLTAIDYAQADIMTLGGLDRRFDLIESVGVLHHLADPLAGWRVLLGLLRPGGIMRLGFYSELARRDIVAGRAFIAGRNHGSSAGDIRRCRQELIATAGQAGFGAFLGWSDFYSLSECRDLLFHVQEHRMTLDAIEAFLNENSLSVIGFTLEEAVLDDYRRRFPDDPAAVNFGNWRIFESDNPDTFRKMYQFWVQKPQ